MAILLGAAKDGSRLGGGNRTAGETVLPLAFPCEGNPPELR